MAGPGESLNLVGSLALSLRPWLAAFVTHVLGVHSYPAAGEWKMIQLGGFTDSRVIHPSLQFRQ